MSTTGRALAAAAVALTLAACGGSSSSSSYPSPGAVIAAMGAHGLRCSSVHAERPVNSDTAESCTLASGETVSAVHFGSDAGRTFYTSFLGGGHAVVGSDWAVTTVTKATAVRIAAAIGGTAS